jgi:flagellar hook-associated protein 2
MSAINDTTDIGVTATVTDGTLTLTSGTSGTAGSLTVTSSIVDSSAQTVSVPTASSENTLAGLAAAINARDMGVTAAVVTNDGYSSLTLTSQTEGSSGALVVTSSVSALSDTALSATVTSGSSSVTSSATLTTVAAAADKLSGSVVIKVGTSGTAQTISLSSGETLAELATAIGTADIGVTASVDSAGTALTLTSGTTGTAGTLTVTSSILDTTNTSTASLAYTSSSDITSLSTLGISLNSDGTISLDVTTLDSMLNSDYSSVQALFQNVDSWGLSFADMLDNVGVSSTTGVLSLAEDSNSSIESTLNTNISREDILISAESKSLTAELNSANEIMQMIPMQVSEINELYSAITGYGQSS